MVFAATADCIRWLLSFVGPALIAVAQGDPSHALPCIEKMLTVLAEHPRAGLDEPFYAYLVCYRMLDGLKDPRTATVLRTAHELLHTYADYTLDDTLRLSFLERSRAS